MERKESYEEKCSACGETNGVVAVYSDFFAANREREREDCAYCGKPLVSVRCLSIYVGKTLAEAQAAASGA